MAVLRAYIRNNESRVVAGLFLFFLFATIVPLFIGFSKWRVETFEASPLPETSYLISADGRVLYEFFSQNRKVVKYEDIPTELVNAFIAAEDKRFREHHGVDPWSVLRAMIINVATRSFAQGFSTITQQLVSDTFLDYYYPSKWEALYGKVKEVFYALAVEFYYTKNEILYHWLNRIYLGRGAYGVWVEAQKYFGKDILRDKLTLAECAYLAGMPNKPGKLDKDHELALKRKDYVLGQMLEIGFIDQSSYKQAMAEQPELKSLESVNPNSSHFVQSAAKFMKAKFGSRLLRQGGVKIHLTIDAKMQETAEAAIEKRLAAWDRQYKKSEPIEASLLSVDADTGEIKAYVGGRDFKRSQYDRVTMPRRSPGSAFKPFFYAAAFEEKKLRPYDLMLDARKRFKRNFAGTKWYSPENYDRVYEGLIFVKDAFARSKNLVAIKVLEQLGIKRGIEYLRKFGIESEIPEDISIALGSPGVPLFELTRAYTAFAANGYRVEPFMISSVVDCEGREIYWHERTEKTKVISHGTALNMKTLMRDVVLRGTGKPANVSGLRVYGKTGTTQNYKDALFVGFSKHLTTGLWVGYDNYATSMGRAGNGTNLAARIWGEYMRNLKQAKKI